MFKLMSATMRVTGVPRTAADVACADEALLRATLSTATTIAITGVKVRAFKSPP